MRKRGHTTGITIHTAATRPSLDADVKMIRRWHKGRGWSDIGYHFVLKRDGTRESGRGIDLVGAHEPRANGTDIGICMVGGVKQSDGKTPEDNYTDEQWAGLKSLIADLYVKYGDLPIRGHRDWSPDRDGDGKIEKHEWMKACPCFDASPWAWQNGFVGALPKPGTKVPPKEVNVPTVRLPVLRRGSQGVNVKRLQKYLNNKGASLTVDGDFGPATQRALMRFQKASGIVQDGICGKQSWKKLKEK